MPSIVSTLSQDNEYILYKKQAGHNIPLSSVIIKGGTGVVNKKNLVVPEGLVTSVTKDQLAQLELNPMFNQHVKNGFVKVCEGGKVDEEKAEKIAKNELNAKDGGAQATEEDFEKQQLPTPSTDVKASDEDVDALPTKGKGKK